MIQVSFAFLWRPTRWKVEAVALKIWEHMYMAWVQFGPLEITVEIDHDG